MNLTRRFAARGPRSIRTRLMIWNGIAVAAIVGVLGAVVEYSVQTYLMASVDRQLAHRAEFFTHPHPPMGGPGPHYGRDPADGPDRHSGFGQGDGPGPGDRPASRSRPGRGPQQGDPSGPELDAGDGRDAGPDGAPPNQRTDGPDANRPPDAPDEDRSSSLARIGSPPAPPGDVIGRLYSPLVIDMTGRVVVPASRKVPWDSAAFRSASQGVTRYTNVQVDDDSLRVLTCPLKDQGDRGRVIGVAQIAYPLNEVQRALDELRRALFSLIPITLLLAGFGGAAITGRALKPMGDITATAERIGGEDLSRRLPVIGDDEFARLASTFNGMLARLEMTFSQREALVRQLEAVVEQQRRFTADASHELRTPLTVIKANTSLSLREDGLPDSYKETLEDIDSAADSMERLVHDLLLLARADDGRLGRDAVAVPVAAVLEEAVRRIRRAGIAPIELATEPGCGAFSGNRDELIRLFSNLIENAIRHTPVDGKITVSAHPDDERVRVTVQDTGIGIPAEHLPHLGERFYRVEAARSRPGGGTGLGLSICKGIVDAHGGTIAIASEVGRGTVVTVRLPRGSSAC